MIEYKILKEIESNPSLTQRSLAVSLGVSLGKINHILADLVRKGVVVSEKTRNQSGALRWHYYLTPDGIQEKIRIARGYLSRRKIEFSVLKNEIAELEEEVKFGE